MSKKLLELFENKVNLGAMTEHDVALAHTGPCGDTIKLYLKIHNGDVINDAAFQYVGCPTSAACGSVLTQMLIGKTLQEARDIRAHDVEKALGGLPDDEGHCAELVVTTLHETLRKYKGDMQSDTAQT
jgi:nitrogen fixation NifU-like protein